MKKTFTCSILHPRKFEESCCFGKEIQMKYPLLGGKKLHFQAAQPTSVTFMPED